MLCQHCKKNEATTHVKQNINGEITEYMLCRDCAKELGYGNMLSDFHSDFNSLLGSFFSTALPARTGATRCPVCGSSYNDIARSGNVGCASCYDVFEEQLMPTLRKVHGNTRHSGKHPGLKGAPDKPAAEQPSDRKARLQEELERAIKDQNFERAAELRDEIKGMEA